MAPRGFRKKKQKKIIYRGFPEGFQLPADSTVNQPGSISNPTTGSTRTGSMSEPTTGSTSTGSISKPSSGSDSEPETVPAIRYCKKKMSPEVIRKMNALKRPDISRMQYWSSDEYSMYDQYIIKKWEILGWDKTDSVYVSIRDFHSKVSLSARKYYKYKQAARGKELPPTVQDCPDPSKMFSWSGEDYDHYDKYLIRKWQSSGWDKADSVYVSIRNTNSAVYKAAARAIRK